uniref:5'-nucleotidase domain-containing protein 3 n=1 Tax=Rhabditophanes sp. KR3021 TaxID=114890 RepID=A0AC35TW52_9BILA
MATKVLSIHKRMLTTRPVLKPNDLWDIYKATKLKALGDAPRREPTDPRQIYANNEINLQYIGAYGFDYDYTLCVYKRELNKLIYDQAMDYMIKEKRFPNEFKDMTYDPNFAIRGLHYDIRNSCLLKIDAFNQIQIGSVFRGKKRLTYQETVELYNSDLKIAESVLHKLPQMIDLFSLPFAGLLANVVEYCDSIKFPFDPWSIYDDVKDAIGHVHVSGKMYEAVMNDTSKYIHKNESLGPFLQSVKEKNAKELFIITNSPFSFVNAGMTYMIDKNWRDLFKYVVVSARKPNFFKNAAPFRLYDEETCALKRQIIHKLEPGKIYYGGNISQFSEYAEFKKPGVLYFGDHIYSDLAEPILKLGWRTAGIVPELAREIRMQNEPDFVKSIVWIDALTELSERYQYTEEESTECADVLKQWDRERRETRHIAKAKFNEQFGSLFRTHHNMTCFSNRLSRLADIYTSRVPNFQKYTNNQKFYPRRIALPHDAR